MSICIALYLALTYISTIKVRHKLGASLKYKEIHIDHICNWISLSQVNMQKDQCEDTNDVDSHPQETIRTIQCNGEKWFQIDQRYVPLLFRFKYTALLQVRISNDPKVPPYAHWLFQQLMKKVLTTRYSSTKSRKNLLENTRMKSQQKVKFLIRAFEIKYCKQFGIQEYSRMMKFNNACQQQFFNKEEVKQHFLAFLPSIIKEKQRFNQHRITEVEKDLGENIRLGIRYPEKGKDHFRRVVNKLQLPWTDNMFTDILTFGKKLFNFYVKGVKRRQEDKQKEGLIQQGIEAQI